MKLSRVSLVAVALLSGCGGAAPAAIAPTSAEPVQSAPEPEVQESLATGVPSRCVSQKGECLPESKWVDALCDGVFAEVALVMFSKGTPWQRMYLRRKTDAINASGGATVTGSIPIGEEVLVLRHRNAGKNDIQIGSPKGQYDALRWSGSCVSLEGEEVSAKRPSRVRHDRVEWKWLGEDMRKSLRKSDAITKAYRARRKECRGARSGAVSKKCQRLDGAFSAELVKQVRAGLSLAEPEQQP